ncbi:sugar transporter [Vibrio salinus]|uniref:sugar transporter n=1 Tax=Vibrio salinus TaxID=2899784 RepID=UPI001E4D2730|nr:sugar transporter [Vibrio salinus]MCE0494483.1 sugar transporter [Vibrio salinus]
MSPSKTTQTRQILALTVAGFIFQTTEFVPVGLLSDITTEFHMSVEGTGWMLTIYAWIVASLSLPLIILTRKIERKQLMIGVFILFIFSHIFSFCAGTFEQLLFSRIGVAVAHSLFWSMTANLAIRLVPPERKPFALSMIATGTSLALILGVPVGRILGQFFSWRVAFVAIAIMALLVLLALIRLLPVLPSTFKGSVRQVSELFRSRLLLLLYLFTFLVFVSHFTTYSYIEPFLKNVGHYAENSVTLFLLLFGVAAMVGSFLFSRICRYFSPKARFICFTGIVLCSMSLLPSLVSSVPLLFMLIMIWGSTRIMMMLCLQSAVLSTNDKGGDFVMAVFSSIVNIGIGGGALIGGNVIREYGLTNIAYVSVAIGAAAIFVLYLILSKSDGELS